MLSLNKNLKDSEQSRQGGTPRTDSVNMSVMLSYTKTTKLITALYMVTDIVDKSEPIRHKLRHLGAEIISDIHSTPAQACVKIAETVSFLNIASAMDLISEMNATILKKEFLELSQSIKESTENKPAWIEEFLGSTQSIGHRTQVAQPTQTRIGVQKGSTLMKALSDKTKHLSNTNTTSVVREQFDLLKKQRRNSIIKIIKDSGGNATIKDIKVKINTGILGAIIYSEKTLQRELVSMTKDGILNKAGEKRWSRYFLKF
jgi:hypothetical protein